MPTRYSSRTGYTVTKRAPARRAMVRPTQKRVKFGPTTAKFFGLGVLAILAIVMLTQSSDNATTAYKQNEIRTQIGHVDQDIERLQLEAKRAQSLQTIEQTALKEKMDTTNQADYVETGDVAGVSTAKP